MTRRALFAALASLPFAGALARLTPRASASRRAPTVISVGPSGDFRRVADAMRVSRAGDTIIVLPGIHEFG